MTTRPVFKQLEANEATILQSEISAANLAIANRQTEIATAQAIKSGAMTANGMRQAKPSQT